VIVRKLDPTIIEKERESRPLAMQISERFSERCFRRRHRPAFVYPLPQLSHDRPAVFFAPSSPLLRAVPRARGLTLDREEAADDPKSLERIQITGTCQRL
jgi:hypothetical protein